MASKHLDASTARQRICDIPKHHVGRVTAFELLNASTHIVICHLDRVFDPDASVGVSSPAANNTEEVCYLRAAASSSEKLGRDDLADIRAFGRLQAVCDGTVATCEVVVRYHIE